MSPEKLISILNKIRTLADEGLKELGLHATTREPSARWKAAGRERSTVATIDFDKPLRPFIKTYGKGLSGPKKFTLLLSWLAKGDHKKQVELNELQRQWNRMTAKSLLGMEFNRFYAAEARNNDWVEVGKKGLYNLRPSWRGIFKG